MDRRSKTNGAVPLSALKPGLPARVARIDAGCGLVGRLTALGLVPGTLVEINGEGPDMVVNMADVSRVVQAFQGQPYPFANPGSCP